MGENEISYFDEQTETAIEDVVKSLEEVNVKAAGHERANVLRQVDNNIKQAKKNMHNYRLELRRLQEPYKTMYDKKYKDHDAKLKELEAQYRRAKSAKETVQQETEEPEPENAQQVLQTAMSVQDESKASIQRTLRVVNETEGIAEGIQETLHVQTEKIQEIDEDLKELEGELKRASRDIQWFVRTARTDKCLITLFGLIVLCVAFIIIWQIWGPKEDGPAQPPIAVAGPAPPAE
eukprot:TRINITY_DN6354_c0_g1_i1.p1 TRINITY_DN6354_c0_g1~~TRINITY_DN6354_c0_g1_i1.p1  ORF type:complete len:235 (+),score=29.69 TRINITY_DN6354_c0_g1_i1:29-733(+)